MGTSSISFRGERGLPEEEAEDLHALIAALGLGPSVLMGSSSGARTSLILGQLHPADIAALVLSPPTGGGATSPVSIANLSQNYYRQHIPRAQDGGMEAVCEASGHYSAVAERSADSKAALL